MKLVCGKCGAELKKTDGICPNCGEVNKKASGSGKIKGVIIAVVAIFVIVMAFGFFGGASAPVRGYYDYDGRAYYYQKGVWYTYVDTFGWYGIVPDDGLTSNYKEYYKGSEFKDGSGYDDFVNSEYYVADGSVGDFNGGNTEQK